MPRLGHGAAITLDELREARNALVGPTRDMRLGFEADKPVGCRTLIFCFRISRMTRPTCCQNRRRR